MKRKHLITLTLCAAIACSITACGDSQADTENMTQVPNPFEVCDTLADAGEIAGFDMTAADGLDNFEVVEISAIEDEMIQVIYQYGDSEVYVRKATGIEDISGDYNTYSTTSSIEIDGHVVSLRGDDTSVSVAIWSDNGYTYAIDSYPAISQDVMTTLLQHIQ